MAINEVLLSTGDVAVILKVAQTYVPRFLRVNEKELKDLLIKKKSKSKIFFFVRNTSETKKRLLDIQKRHRKGRPFGTFKGKNTKQKRGNNGRNSGKR